MEKQRPGQTGGIGPLPHLSGEPELGPAAAASAASAAGQAVLQRIDLLSSNAD